MTVCESCGKENQDHYKFCLGCGQELKPAKAAAEAPPPEEEPPTVPEAPAPGPAAQPTPPAGIPQANETELDAMSTIESPSTASAPQTSTDSMPGMEEPEIEDAPPPNTDDGPPCDQCGTVNPKGFVFCGNCGNRLEGAPADTAGYAATEPAPSPEPGFWGRLALIRPDGTEGGSHDLVDDRTVIGRGCGALFDNDGYLSPSHAEFRREGNKVILSDAGSLNGVFIKITSPELVEDRSVFRIGQELLRFDLILEPELMEDGTEIMGSPNPGYWGRLSLIVGPSADGSAFPLMGDEVALGRDRGDILFPDDGYVSGIHAKLAYTDEGFFLTDLGSSNGTFLRLDEPREIDHGTYVLMGQQLFRFEEH